MKTSKPLIAAALVMAIGAPVAGFLGGRNVAQPFTSTPLGASFLHGPSGGRMTGQNELASLERADEWINSSPLSASALQGKVVLIDFWTYTCINWLRTLPHVRAWADKYRDQGLVVVGVHSPEFSFEKDPSNVHKAAKDLDVDYPIAVDSGHAIWRAFDNHYWPALYFIDSQGRVRHRHFGEGSYEQSEKVIQKLLAEAGSVGVDRRLVSAHGRGIEEAADWNSLKSPENYLGYERTRNFASGEMAFDESRIYEAPERLRVDEWGLSGDWTARPEAAVLNRSNGKIAYRFHARDLHLVMGAAETGTPVRFRVLIDGKPPGPAHGIDVDEKGEGAVTEPRLYQLIRQSKPIIDSQFEIEFFGSGVEVFAFTFG